MLIVSGCSPIKLAYYMGHEKIVKLLLEHDAGDPYEASDGQESMMEKAIKQKWNKLGHFIFWKKKVYWKRNKVGLLYKLCNEISHFLII